MKRENRRPLWLDSWKANDTLDRAVNGTMTHALHLSLSVHLLVYRRVHISSVTLEHLKGSYKVEPGDGQSRDSYLKEHNVVTYLVINPKVRCRPLHVHAHSNRKPGFMHFLHNIHL